MWIFLKDVAGITVFSVPNSDYFANYWLSAILIHPEKTNGITRESMRLALGADNIESRPLWKPMHLQPIFQQYPYYGKKVAETLFENGLCLPSGSNLTDEDRKKIRDVFIEIFGAIRVLSVRLLLLLLLLLLCVALLHFFKRIDICL
jgi:dTDP-4-amino-4,6-dideoxygalactose transaminase